MTPIFLAVPPTIFIAASISLALRSGIFVWAISCNWALVIVPTFFLLGSLEPRSIFAALRISTDAGGVAQFSLPCESVLMLVAS